MAAVIWGLSFTILRWTLDSFSTTQLLFWRFLIAFVLGEVLFFIFNKKEFKTSFSDAKISIIPGISLGLSLIAQTYGLLYTTATNSGFITSLYVVILPFIAFIFFKHKIKLRHFLLGFLAFSGMGLMLNLKWADLLGQGSVIQSLNRGDLITLIAAVTASVQILFIGTVSHKIKNSFRYNTYQSFWTLITVLPFLAVEMMTSNMGLVPESPTAKSIYSLLALTILVSLIAFSLQVLSQKKLSATTASMLCLLEGPFAFLFAAFFLSESLNRQQAAGVFIILFCSALTIFLDRPNDAHAQNQGAG